MSLTDEQASNLVNTLVSTARRKETEAIRLNYLRNMSLERSGEAKGLSLAARIVADVAGIEIGPVLDSEDVQVMM